MRRLARRQPTLNAGNTDRLCRPHLPAVAELASAGAEPDAAHKLERIEQPEPRGKRADKPDPPKRAAVAAARQGDDDGDDEPPVRRRAVRQAAKPAEPVYPAYRERSDLLRD